MRSEKQKSCRATILAIFLGLFHATPHLSAAAPPLFVRPIASFQPKGEPGQQPGSPMEKRLPLPDRLIDWGSSTRV